MKIKNLFFLQSISNILSVLAIVMAVISLLFASSLKNKINKQTSIKNKQKFVSVSDIPDVEVVKIDGSVAKINATNSRDIIGDLLKRSERNADGDKQANEVEENKKENIKNSPAIVNVKNDGINSNTTNVNTDNTITKKVIPILRNDSITVKDYKKNNVKKKHSNRVVNNKKNIYGKFLVQASAFRSRELAKKQCKKIKEFDNTKHCFISSSTKGQFYRTIVYPFSTYQDALDFASRLSVKLNVNCFVKKNS